MDTDDLSKETYKAIISESEKFHHDLTIHFGVISESCKNEEEYINKSEKLIAEFNTITRENDLLDIFFERTPDLKAFKKTLEKILKNINEVKKIPFEKRHFDF